MICVEEWAGIRRLRLAEGHSIRAIARELGVARNTVRAALRSGEPPRYVRVRRGSMVDAVEDAIRLELQACPAMPTGRKDPDPPPAITYSRCCWPALGEPMRVEHEYQRRAAWAYLTAWDVGRAKIHGLAEPKIRIVPFERRADQVMSQEPCSLPRSRRVMTSVELAVP